MPKVKTRELEAVGRNEPCPCGSGLKFKRCCIGASVAEEEDASGFWLWAALGAAVLIGGGIAMQRLVESGSSDEPERVWSEEHGHWHIVGEPGHSYAAQPRSEAPGAAPPGKVWSEEHGHWHDVSGGVPAGGYAIPTVVPSGGPPPGPAPPGKVWSVDHQHWH